MGWITSDAVATYMKVTSPRQPDLDQIVAAVQAEVERVRSDIDYLNAPPTTDDPVNGIIGQHQNVWFGALLWATDLYQARINANGPYPQYDQDGADLYAVASTKWANISRLIGLRRPVTA